MSHIKKEFNDFYNNNVRVSEEDKNKLREYRETNINRLKKGLIKIDHALPIKIVNQGSFATHTVVQNHNNDFDIDIAIIFNDSEISSNPLFARQKIRDAMLESGDIFKRPPEARTNAVTVWYKEGYHVDFAIHRQIESGELQHAGINWTYRDPIKLADWINKQINEKSPKHIEEYHVLDNQLRRIIQLIKYWTKSRDSWNLPGGTYISILAIECYENNILYDDQSLVQTMKKISDRLNNRLDVYNPIDPTSIINYKDEYTNQLSNLRDKLEQWLPYIIDVYNSNIDKETTIDSWNTFYSDKYWEELKNSNKSNSSRPISKKISQEPSKPYYPFNND